MRIAVAVAVADGVGQVGRPTLAVGPPPGIAPDLVGPKWEDPVYMARQTLTRRGDTTGLLPSWRNVPIGVEAAGEVLLPGKGARVAETSFDAWLFGAPSPQPWCPGPQVRHSPQVSSLRSYRPGRAAGSLLPMDWLANSGPQELPDSLGGLGGLGGVEQELVDVGQALADLQGDVDPGFGGRGGQAFGIAEQQVGRADLNQQRR
jgi:hypothetical protein